MPTQPHFSLLATSFAGGPRPRNAALIIFGLWLTIFFASLFTPPLLDDADATHAQAARHIALTGQLVTLQVDGIRYLEKAPLPYWLAALSFRIFGFNTFAAHLPQALAVLLLALLAYRWANQAFGARTAFYAAIAVLTATGTFLFTRILIPEALLSLLLATALFAFLKSLHPDLGEPRVPHDHRAAVIVGSLTSQHDQHDAKHNTVILSERSESQDLHHPPHLPTKVILSEGATSPQSKDLSSDPSHKETEVILSEGARAPQSKDLQHRSPAAELQATTIAALPESPAHIPPATALYPYLMWTALALAVLTKGLVALVFFTATTLAYLLLIGETRRSLPKLKPVTGLALFLLIAAPWHILAALHNPATPNHPGWVWFYFWNEHVLRFLGRRTPADYNRLPPYLYWALHLVWLFPWSLFLPLGLTALFSRIRHQTLTVTRYIPKDYSWAGAYLNVAFYLGLSILFIAMRPDYFGFVVIFISLLLVWIVITRRLRAHLTPSPFHHLPVSARTILLLSLFAAIVLLFFSLSTNQEYYTFPAYLPILLLTAATITRAEQTYASSPHARRWLTFAHAALLTLGLLISVTLAAALIASRNIPYTPDIATLLAHRHAANDTLSMSHFLDLDLPAFAALRLPTLLAIVALTLGPAIAWLLRMQRRHIAATTAIAFTSAAFLIAAHIALARFAPLLSSKAFADRIQQLNDPTAQTIIYGDQAYGSTLPFYLNQQVLLVDGRTTSLAFGSRFEDAPPIFLTPTQLAATWGHGPRKILFLPQDQVPRAATLTPQYTVLTQSNKLLLTDRPLQQTRKPGAP